MFLFSRKKRLLSNRHIDDCRLNFLRAVANQRFDSELRALLLAMIEKLSFHRLLTKMIKRHSLN